MFRFEMILTLVFVRYEDKTFHNNQLLNKVEALDFLVPKTNIKQELKPINNTIISYYLINI